MKNIDGNALRGHLEGMALSVLDRGEAHGYEVLQRLQALGCGALKLREGSLYPALYRLESAGLIRAHWEKGTGARRGPRRRIYAVTPRGRRELRTRRESWKDFVSVVGSIMEASS